MGIAMVHWSQALSKSEHWIEVIVRGVWIQDARVLLCQNLDAGYYYLPGGHVEFGESAALALAREFEEETGCDVIVGDCALAVEGAFRSGKRMHHELNLLFPVKHPPADVQSKEPGIGFVWVDLASVVELDVRPEAIKAWLASGGGRAAGMTYVSTMNDAADQS